MKLLFEDKDNEYKRLFVEYSFCHNDKICLIKDNSKYINHSNDRNLCFKDDNSKDLVAMKDLKKGEQFFEDYRCF